MAGREPAQQPGQVRAAYDVVADDYASLLRGTAGEAPVDIAMIAHLCSQVAGERRVLDAGCGAGRLLPVLAGLGCRPQGVDLSPGMIRCARRDHPGFETHVASLTALPFADASFDGVMSWYSTIHSPDDDVRVILGELCRVSRPGAPVLLGFQAGVGTHDSGATYRSRGHDVELLRFNRSADAMAALARGAGLVERARLVRAAEGREREPQAMLLRREE